MSAAIAIPLLMGLGSFSIILTLIYYLVLLPIYNVFFHPLRKYPGPVFWKASIIPWTWMFVSGKSHYKLLELHNRFGPIIRISPNELSYVVPEAWEPIWGYRKGRTENLRAPWFCNPRDRNLLTASHEEHLGIRRLLSHGFSTSAMLQQEPIIKTHIDLLMERLGEYADSQVRVVDLSAWAMYCSFDIIGDLALGEPFGCLRDSALHPWISLIFANIRLMSLRIALNRFPVLHLFLPFLVPRKMQQQASEHKQLTREKVGKRLALKDPRPDFFQGLITGTGDLCLGREQLESNGEVITMAGSETTASLLSGAVYQLTTHPRVMAILVEEITSSFNSEDEITLISAGKLQYLCAVTEESLRTFPPGTNTQPRITPPEGNIVLGDHLPGNTIIGIPHRAMYYTESNFKRAHEFIPERWMNHPEFASDRRDCFNPFGVGPRSCLGMNLAYAEFRLILARLLFNFKVEIEERSRNWMAEQRSYLFWEKSPLYINLSRRTSRAETLQ